MSVVLAEPQPTGPAAAGLEEWAQSFLTLAQVSGEMARTAFVPASLRVFHGEGKDRVYDPAATAAQVTAAILTGRELGLEPMASLRSIHVINSTPALAALALRAVVLAAGHRMWVEEANNTRAVVAGVRAGDTHEQRVTWTMDDAKARGLAGKQNWRTQPRNMLIARATAEVARLVAADAILGVPYVLEELEDGDVEPAALPAPPPAAETKPLRRRQQPARPVVSRSQPAVEPRQPAEDDPPLDDQTPATEPAPRASRAQLRKLFAAFKARGLTDRDDRLDWANQRLDRTIVSAAELTDIEASRLIDALEESVETEVSTEELMLDEAKADDSWLRQTLADLGAQIPAGELITIETLRGLTPEQAARLRTAFTADVDTRTGGE